MERTLSTEVTLPQPTIVVEQGMLAQYSLYVLGGIGAVAMVGVVIYVRKIRS